jgi:ATP-dependent DNA helicase RecG
VAGLGTSLAEVIGGRSATSLYKAHGVVTCEDLVWLMPRRYQDMATLSDTCSLRVGDIATVLARVKTVNVRATRKGGQMMNVTITDGANDLHLAFFKGIPAYRRQLQPGRVGLFNGKVGEYRGELQLAHPVCIMAPTGDDTDIEAAEAFLAKIQPIYPATATMPSWRIARTISMVLDALDFADDPIDDQIRERRGLMTQQEAFASIHRPSNLELPKLAAKRLRYQEAFALQTILALRRQAVAASPAAVRAGNEGGLADALMARLPFTLTQGQRDAIAAIRADIAEPTPMQRLLHGEVGAGKTLVALLAMATVVDSGGQSALLAPTEVLAQQHHTSISAMLGEYGQAGMIGGQAAGTQVVLLTGSMPAAARREAMLKIVSGQAGIVIGTHALLNEKVQFADLGLVIVDEQHRFGVEQRAALLERGVRDVRPHLLVMTATPIPRTVAMTVFGDLDVTTLKELPQGRAGISSFVVDEHRAPRHARRMWERVVEEVTQGRKVYVVCPRIGDEDPTEEFDTLTTRGVLRTASDLADTELSAVRVGVLHGRMPPVEKTDVMRRFAADAEDPQAIDVLVATSVIEVGVDVPSASMMIVLDAESFGISQLHQLRGRVGRGTLPGLCLLDTRNPDAVQRLEYVASTTNGFDLATYDLRMRKEGDVLGTAQSGGMTTLRVLRVVRDEDIIEAARADVAEVLARDPGLREHRSLRAMVNRWQSASEYVEKA